MTQLLRLNNKRFYSLFSIGIFCCIATQAQKKLSAKYFEGTTWIVCDKDSSFFKSDTIRAVRLVDKGSTNKGDSKDMAGYFNGSDFITMEFKKAKALIFFTTKVDSWEIVKKKGKYIWKFNNQTQILKLYFNSKLFATFKPVFQSLVQIKSEYIDRPPTPAAEIIMKRLD